MYIISPVYEERSDGAAVIYNKRSKKLELVDYEFNYKRTVPTVFQSKKYAESCIQKLYDGGGNYIDDCWIDLELNIMKVNVI